MIVTTTYLLVQAGNLFLSFYFILLKSLVQSHQMVTKYQIVTTSHMIIMTSYLLQLYVTFFFCLFTFLIEISYIYILDSNNAIFNRIIITSHLFVTLTLLWYCTTLDPSKITSCPLSLCQKTVSFNVVIGDKIYMT